MTTEELVKKYKALYKSKMGKDLSEEEALDQALKEVSPAVPLSLNRVIRITRVTHHDRRRERDRT